MASLLIAAFVAGALMGVGFTLMIQAAWRELQQDRMRRQVERWLRKLDVREPVRRTPPQ